MSLRFPRNRVERYGHVAVIHSRYEAVLEGSGRTTLQGNITEVFVWNGSGWTQVAKSESETSSERIAYSGTAGYYVIRVVNFAGSGSYSLTLQKP